MSLSEDRDTRLTGTELPTTRASWFTAVMLLAPLSLLGELILSKTHHRPLGAAVFATVAMTAWALGEVLSRFALSRTTSSARVRARNAVWLVSLLCSAAVLLRAVL